MKTKTIKNWVADNFSIRILHVDYLESTFEAKELLETMEHYEIKYDPDITSVKDSIVVRLDVTVNADGTFPGYRIECQIQTAYILPDWEKEYTKDLISPQDIEYFINDMHETMQDHLLVATEDFPLGEYLLPPLDLDGLLHQQINNLLNGN